MSDNLVGPMDLSEALDAAEYTSGGIQMAVSSPEGTYVALRDRRGQVIVRKVNEMKTGCGSQMGTGRWVDPIPAWLACGSWRPA